MSERNENDYKLLIRAVYNLTQLLTDLGDERGGPISFTEIQKLAFQDFIKFRERVCLNSGLPTDDDGSYLISKEEELRAAVDKHNDTGQPSS